MILACTVPPGARPVGRDFKLPTPLNLPIPTYTYLHTYLPTYLPTYLSLPVFLHTYLTTCLHILSTFQFPFPRDYVLHTPSPAIQDVCRFYQYL